MKALILTRPGKIELKEIPKPILSAGKALVKIKSASLNRRDNWISEGKYPNIKFGVTMGSDGAGDGSASIAGLLGSGDARRETVARF